MDKQIWIRQFLKQKLTIWLIVPILLFAFWIRVHNLSTNPPELFSDEITQVLSARSIIETGKDINGKTNLFLYNKIKLGTPIYGYLAATSTYILGNNPFAVRLPAAIAGTISVLFIYLISEHITKNRFASLTASFIGSIVPWGVYFSRIGWEPALTIPFLLVSVYSLLKSIESKNKRWIIFSFCLFGISVYASDALEFLSPLFLSTILLINWRLVFGDFKKYFVASIYFVIILIPLIYVALTNPLKHDRSFKISTFREGVNETSLNIFKENYISHFNYDYFFKTGDPNLRHGTGTDGVLYLSMLPFLVFGFLYILKDYKTTNSKLLIFWLLFFPLGGSLTNDGIPHATRTLIGWPLFAIVSAIGVKGTIETLDNKKLSRALILLFFLYTAINFNKFYINYFENYPVRSQSWWEYGQKQVYDYIKQNTQGNESLCLGNIDYWHDETLNNYYFGLNFKYQILYDLNNEECLKSDILVLPYNFGIKSNYILKKTIYDLEYNPKWEIFYSTNR